MSLIQRRKQLLREELHFLSAQRKPEPRFRPVQPTLREDRPPPAKNSSYLGLGAFAVRDEDLLTPRQYDYYICMTDAVRDMEHENLVNLAYMFSSSPSLDSDKSLWTALNFVTAKCDGKHPEQAAIMLKGARHFLETKFSDSVQQMLFNARVHHDARDLTRVLCYAEHFSPLSLRRTENNPRRRSSYLSDAESAIGLLACLRYGSKDLFTEFLNLFRLGNAEHSTLLVQKLRAVLPFMDEGMNCKEISPENSEDFAAVNNDLYATFMSFGADRSREPCVTFALGLVFGLLCEGVSAEALEAKLGRTEFSNWAKSDEDFLLWINLRCLSANPQHGVTPGPPLAESLVKLSQQRPYSSAAISRKKKLSHAEFLFTCQQFTAAVEFLEKVGETTLAAHVYIAACMKNLVPADTQLRLLRVLTEYLHTLPREKPVVSFAYVAVLHRSVAEKKLIHSSLKSVIENCGRGALSALCDPGTPEVAGMPNMKDFLHECVEDFVSYGRDSLAIACLMYLEKPSMPLVRKLLPAFTCVVRDMLSDVRSAADFNATVLKELDQCLSREDFMADAEVSLRLRVLETLVSAYYFVYEGKYEEAYSTLLRAGFLPVEYSEVEQLRRFEHQGIVARVMPKMLGYLCIHFKSVKLRYPSNPQMLELATALERLISCTRLLFMSGIISADGLSYVEGMLNAAIVEKRKLGSE